MLYVVAIRVGTPPAHERITHAKWLNCDTGKSDRSTTAAMITWLEASDTNAAKVAGPEGSVRVGVWNTDSGKHLRTYANEEWSDNLLSLPRF